CGLALTSASGVITSPSYPNPYQHNRVCEWTITAANGNQILLNITDLDFSFFTHCHNEFLEIRNGDSETAPLMQTFCFNYPNLQTAPQALQSHSNKLYLKFRSNYYTTGRGFRLEYSSATSGCGGDLTTPTGGIISPNYPQPFTHSATCYWTITVSQGSSITLYFVDLQISAYSYCRSDFLEIKEESRSGTSLGKFCGSGVRQPVISKSNRVWLMWKTDGLTVQRGFRLQYQINCNRHLTGIGGVIESPNFPNTYPHHTNCTWIIEAPAGNRINVSFAAFRLEDEDPKNCHYDILEIRDGGDSNAREMKKLCGGNFPDPVQSTGNHLWLNFKADHIIAHQGFRLEWVVDGCGGHLSGSSGTITSPNDPHLNSQRAVECQWTITVDTGKSIQVTVNTFDLGSYVDCQNGFLK
ncbi:unnamed protein product, partial [Candidula unifasciata]